LFPFYWFLFGEKHIMAKKLSVRFRQKWEDLRTILRVLALISFFQYSLNQTTGYKLVAIRRVGFWIL
jgi:hypothetical protein